MSGSNAAGAVPGRRVYYRLEVDVPPGVSVLVFSATDSTFAGE